MSTARERSALADNTTPNDLSVNHRGQSLDRYGRKTVYEGVAHGRHERYLVWYGHYSPGSSSYQGDRKTFRSLTRAIRRAQAWQRAGYDTQITDRLEEA